MKTFQAAVDSLSSDPGADELCARACAGLAECYLKQGDREHAIAYWKLAVRKSDWSEIPAANLGEVLFAAGDSRGALEYYLIAARIAPERAELLGVDEGLRAYVARRLGFAVLMLVGVSLILFTIMRLAPGGPEAVLIGGEFSPVAAAQIRERLGLDRPLAAQYLTWAGAAARGDLGRSFKTGEPVAARAESAIARAAWSSPAKPGRPRR